MTIMDQCQIWHREAAYQKIIDALDALDDHERTPELDCELAWAYNNIAELDEKPLYEKAIALLKPHADYFQGNHSWNFRIAYAYYYLDQEGPALHYFQQALEALPGDQDTQEFIEDCRRRLSLPMFEKPFLQRTQEAWAAFQQIEAELRELMDQDPHHQRGEAILAKCSQALELAFHRPAFALGRHGENYELILSAEGTRAKLFPLVYVQNHAPASLLEHWSIRVGRPPSRSSSIHAGDLEIFSEEVRVWIEPQEGHQVSLTLYCEKLLPLLQEQEQQVWWVLPTLTDQVLGEVASISLIRAFEVVDTPREGPSVPLSQLSETLKGMGLSLCSDARTYLENSDLTYEREPVQTPNTNWRSDLYRGSTRLPILMDAYLRGESTVMDEYHMDGIVPGFLFYPVDGFTGDQRAAAMLEFRDALQTAILENAGEDAVTFLGEGAGLFHNYLDFIAWDLQAVLDAAVQFLSTTELPWAAFHTFRPGVRMVQLWARKDTTPHQAADSPNENAEVPELYTSEELEAVECHIDTYFGSVGFVCHELSSPDIHVDIEVIPPTEERNYYTLVTVGMGAHRMSVPEELAEYRLERAELAIHLPPNWRLEEDALREETWYWPIRLLKVLARLPIVSRTWIGWGHTIDNQGPFAAHTELCGAMLIDPQLVQDGGPVCRLPNGEKVNFYQVLPLYQSELDYKKSHSAEALLDKMGAISSVVQPNRPNAIDIQPDEWL